MKHTKIVTAVLTTAILLVLVILAGVVVVYSGLSDVAASKPEGALTSWVLGTAMDHSVRRHASGISPDLSRADLAEGAEHYAAMCTMCHGGPGGESPNYIGLGLNPAPPDLRESAGDWKAGEIYWILDNGIKMTGMPAFGKTHSPEQLTNITAFVVKMPTMTTQEYQRLKGAGPATSMPSGAESREHHD
jgi:mono/diheme cytochrome c family protein